jgi:hypothetical protein
MIQPPGFPWARLVANDLVEVRPLGPPNGLLFFITPIYQKKFKYGK